MGMGLALSSRLEIPLLLVAFLQDMLLVVKGQQIKPKLNPLRFT